MPGSTRERHALLQRQIVTRHDVGLLVHRQTDAVPGAVHERLRQAFRGEHVARDGVDLFGGDPGPHRLDRGRWARCSTEYRRATSGSGSPML